MFRVVIIERESELRAVSEFLDRVNSGNGGGLLIEATAGLGKTTLIARMRELADARGVDVLHVRAGHLDASLPYVILRRLLGVTVHRGGGAGSLTGAAAFAAPLFDPDAVLDPAVGYGAQWLVTGLGEKQPTLVIVDDAHWADPASLQVLTQVAEDAGCTSIGVVLASRPTEGPEAQQLLAGLSTSTLVTTLRPGPLSPGGVFRVAAGKLDGPDQPDQPGRRLDAAGAERLHRASAGNPLVLLALLSDREVGELVDLPGYVPGALSAAIGTRLAQLGPETAAVAHAAAVLEGTDRLRLLAAVSGYPQHQVITCVERLRAASMIDADGAFPHPVVREAVEASASPEWIRHLHARTAGLLLDEHAEAGVVIPHALAGEPAGDPRVAEALFIAGRAADRAGSPLTAVELLMRAEAEPPSRERLPEVVLEIGRVELRLGRPGAEPALRRLLQLTDSPRLRSAALERLVEVAYSRGARHLWQDVLTLAVPLLAQTATSGDEEAVALRAALAYLTFATGGPAVPPEVASLVRDPAELPLRHAADQLYALFCARALVLRNELDAPGFAAVVRRLMDATPAEVAHDDPRQAEVELVAASYLMASDEFDLVDALCDRAARRPQVIGAPDLQLQLQTRRLGVALRRGELREVLAGAELAIADAHRLGALGYVAYLSSYLARAHLGAGRPGAALAALVPTSTVIEIELLRHLLRAEYDDAVALHDRAICTQEGLAWQSRLLLARAYLALGNGTAAARLIEAEIAGQQAAGSRGLTADAMRMMAGLLGGDEGLDLLREAAQTVSGSPRLAVRSEVLTDLGVALLEHGDSAGAREVLPEAIELAVRTGSAPALERAGRALRRAGGRPRRLHQTGVESLTPSERRVATLAATGLTNREVAEELFLSLKTVETHLGATYRKLGVSGRSVLVAALNGER